MLFRSNLAKKSNVEGTMSGFFDGDISFQGNQQDINTLTGKGQIYLRDGIIWQFPVFLAMLDIFSLPSSKPAFREGIIQFSISKQFFEITSMEFISSLLALSGRGRIAFKGDIELIMLTHFTMDIIPRIPFVEKVLDNFKKNIFAIQVAGTLNKPTITLKQWRDLRNFFDISLK